MDQGRKDCDHFREPPSGEALLAELLDDRTLFQVWNPSEFAIELSYPSLDKHAQKRGDEDDAEARKEESIDSDGIGRWREHWGNVWPRCAVLHDERLVEEDVLEGAGRVWLEETEGLDEKCGQEGGEECSLGCKRCQLRWVLLGLSGLTKMRMTSRISCHSRSRSSSSMAVLPR